MPVVVHVMYIEVRLPYTRRAFFLWWPDRVKEEACKKRTLTMEREASSRVSQVFCFPINNGVSPRSALFKVVYLEALLYTLYRSADYHITRRAFFLWWPDRVKEEACKKRTLTSYGTRSFELGRLFPSERFPSSTSTSSSFS